MEENEVRFQENDELTMKQAEQVTGGAKSGSSYACPICGKRDYKILPNKQLRCNACGNTWSPK